MLLLGYPEKVHIYTKPLIRNENNMLMIAKVSTSSNEND